MPNYDENGPLGTGPRMGRGLGRCGRRHDKTRSAEDPHWNEVSGRYGRPAGGGLGRPFGPAKAPTGSSAGPGTTAHQQERSRSGPVEILLTTEVDRLRHTASAYLRGNADELTAELDTLKRLLSEYFPGDAEELTAELYRLKHTASECVRREAETLTAELDRLKETLSEWLRDGAKGEG